MAAPLSTSPTLTPAPGPSNTQDHSRVADALYNWCRDNGELGDVFNQQQLLGANIIPNGDTKILLHAATHLVQNHLFKIHDVKTADGSTIGWELISSERAANYKNLTRDEHMIYSIIDSAGTAGIWTKTIKAKSNVHSKVADKVIKALESGNLIKPMKSVKNPNRKMYIVSGLTPSEEATGGAWFTDGVLDEDLIDSVASAIENIVSKRSWKEAVGQVDGSSQSESAQKRKAPQDGFDGKGKGKAKSSKIDDHQPRSQSPESRPPKPKSKPATQKFYEPQNAGYQGYLTAKEISDTVNKMRFVNTSLPQNAIEQLLEVMVYDDRLYKLFRPPRDGEAPDAANGHVTMFKSYLNHEQIVAKHKLGLKLKDRDYLTRKSAYRLQELEDIGSGGSTEMPCLRCPVLHLCEDGGPVNVESCGYFDDWFKKMDEADRETETGAVNAEQAVEVEPS